MCKGNAQSTPFSSVLRCHDESEWILNEATEVKPCVTNKRILVFFPSVAYIYYVIA